MRINDMGIYRLYRRLPDVKHEFRWKYTPPKADRERIRDSLKEFPIEEMGCYLALENFNRKHNNGNNQNALAGNMLKTALLIQEMRMQGYTYDVISQKTGLGRTSLYNYLSKLKTGKF